MDAEGLAYCLTLFEVKAEMVMMLKTVVIKTDFSCRLKFYETPAVGYRFVTRTRLRSGSTTACRPPRAKNESKRPLSMALNKLVGAMPHDGLLK